MKKSKEIKGTCKFCGNEMKIKSYEISSAADIRNLFRCPDGFVRCTVCHRQVKMG